MNTSIASDYVKALKARPPVAPSLELAWGVSSGAGGVSVDAEGDLEFGDGDGGYFVFASDAIKLAEWILKVYKD